MATVSFSETVKWSDIDVTADQLIDLFREHAPDVFEEVVVNALGEALAERAAYDTGTYGPIMDGLRELAVSQGIEAEREDIVDVSYDA